MVNWGGRCCTCSEWGRRARIAFLTSNRSLLGRSDGSAKLSLPRHRAFTPAGISPATITPPCATGAQRYELFWGGRRRQKAPGTFDEFLFIVGLTRGALRSWQPGAHRRRSSLRLSARRGTETAVQRNCPVERETHQWS